jgi:hypothetical protein
MRIFSFDTENMYTNLPKHDIVNILEIIQKPIKTPRMKYYKYYKHWVDTGAPTSAILVEIYLQHMEHKQYPVLIKQAFTSDVLNVSL